MLQRNVSPLRHTATTMDHAYGRACFTAVRVTLRPDGPVPARARTRKLLTLCKRTGGTESLADLP